MDVLKILLVLTLGLSVAKKLAKGVLKIVIILGVLAYLAVKILV